MDRIAPEAELLVRLLEAGVESARPRSCLPRAVRVFGDQILLRDVRDGQEALVDLPGKGRIVLLCVGKCALGSALALGELLGERVGRGLVIDREQEQAVRLPAGLLLLAGDHPLAGERSLLAGAVAVELVASLIPGDLLLACVSGGASALMELPAEGVSVDQLFTVPQMMMRRGAGVLELLDTRAALSALKRGGLLRRVPGGVQVAVLVLSDVRGDDPATVGGAPFHPASGVAPIHVVVVNNTLARTAVGERAGALGLRCQDLGEHFGTPRQVAAALCNWSRSQGEAEVAVLGGEAVCPVRGPGRGGRNLEVVAECLAAVSTGRPGAVAAVDTDGIDGTGPLSGAVAWPSLAAALLPLVAPALERSDSASLFRQTCGRAGALCWGPTGANISDLRVVLRDAVRLS